MSKHHLKIMHEMKGFYEAFFKDWDIIQDGLQVPSSHCAVLNKYFKADKALNIMKSNNATQILLHDTSTPVNRNVLGDEQTKICRNRHSFPDSLKSNPLIKPAVHGLSSDYILALEELKVFAGTRFASPYIYRTSKTGLLPYYLMDLSSLLPVMALQIRETDHVLDMCAAPGGKTVVIMQLLSSNGSLVCNDASKHRFNRLKKVVQEYLPAGVLNNDKISILNWNGELFCDEEKSSFDKVLVDAPCSSERHVIQKESKYGGWSIRKMKENAKVQIKLLSSALKAAKPGGKVVYSTCSISPYENDGVVETALKLSKKYNIVANTDANNLKDISINCFPKETFYYPHNLTHGVLVLPTMHCNWGPMYVSEIRRLS